MIIASGMFYIIDPFNKVNVFSSQLRNGGMNTWDKTLPFVAELDFKKLNAAKLFVNVA